MSLCFLQALSKAKLTEGGITEQEYHRHLLAHLQGVRHSEDSIPSVGDTLQAIEPWAGSLREIALKSDYDPLKDISCYMELFAACAEGNMEKFKQSFESSKQQVSPSLLQPAACLSAQKEHHQILRFCLDRGAVFDRYLNRAAQLGARSVEMLELLLAANWCDIQQSTQEVDRQITYFGEDSFQGKWLKEHGAKKARKVIRSSDPKQGPSPEQLQKWFGDVPW